MGVRDWNRIAHRAAVESRDSATKDATMDAVMSWLALWTMWRPPGNHNEFGMMVEESSCALRSSPGPSSDDEEPQGCGAELEGTIVTMPCQVVRRNVVSDPCCALVGPRVTQKGRWVWAGLIQTQGLPWGKPWQPPKNRLEQTTSTHTTGTDPIGALSVTSTIPQFSWMISSAWFRCIFWLATVGFANLTRIELIGSASLRLCEPVEFWGLFLAAQWATAPEGCLCKRVSRRLQKASAEAGVRLENELAFAVRPPTCRADMSNA